MKKTIQLCTVAALALMLASCGGHSPLKLSEKTILKQCNKNLVEFGLDSATVSIYTGYYELNDEQMRCELERLEAAGVINYDVERYAWWETKRERKSIPHTVDYYYTWTGAYAYSKTEYTTKWVTNYTFNEHFMVNVELTDQARQYLLDHRPLPKLVETEDVDFQQPIFYDTLYPEYLAECNEVWPEIPHPLADEVYNKCMGIINEAEALLDAATELNGYNKAEQKLNTLNNVDNFNHMTSVQKEEVNDNRERLAEQINRKKGDEAYNKVRAIIMEANELLNNAANCRDLEKVENKLASRRNVRNTDLMSTSQSDDISDQISYIQNVIRDKKNEFGCNPVVEAPEPIEEEIEIEEVPVDDDRDPVAIAYDNAKANEHQEEAILFAYIKKAIIARNIKIGQDESGTHATAEVIYQISKVTDAARVLNRCIDKFRTKGMVSFSYFCDKGWEMDERPNEVDYE